ncbi:hypothetical protein RF55_22157, partial [Lasius niger]
MNGALTVVKIEPLAEFSLDFIRFTVNLTAIHDIVAFRFHCLVKPFTDAVCLRANAVPRSVNIRNNAIPCSSKNGNTCSLSISAAINAFF